MKKALAAPAGFALFNAVCMAVTAAACVAIARQTQEIMIVQDETLEILRKAQANEGGGV